MAVYVRSLCLSNNTQRRFSKICSSQEETWSIEGVYEPPFPDRNHKIVGYCNGLYCLEYENGTSLIWNPSMNEFKFLPPSGLKIPHCPSPICPVIDCTIHTTSAVRGLGFDPKSGDYKVVRLAANFYNHPRDCYSVKQVEVYSLLHDSWEEISSEGDQYYIMEECATYLDGRCYWIGQAAVGDLVISLDLSSHEFSILRLPPIIGFPFHEFGYILTEYEGSLAFVVYMRRERPERRSKTIFCWVRGDVGEWVKKMDFKFRGAERPLGFCGDFMLFEGLDGGLLSYDYQQKLFRKIMGIHDHSHCMCLSSFVESNVSLTTARDGKCKWALKRHKEKKRKEKKRKDDEGAE